MFGSADRLRNPSSKERDMRSTKMMGSTLVAVLMLASSASAATWDPPGTVVHGHGTVSLTTGSFLVTCTADTNLKASGAVATTTNGSGVAAGPTFSGCTNNLGISPTHVTSTSAWVATATSTTSVDLANFNYIIAYGGGACEITVTNTALPNNGWSNTTHTFTFSSATSYAQHRTGFCPTASSTGTLTGSIVFPASAVIT